MSAKNVLLVALVLVNLLILSALVLNVTSPKEAQAQRPRGGGNDYVIVTARSVQGDEDALWALDLGNRKLYVLRLPQGAAKEMILVGSRDLLRDLRNEKKEVK